MMADPFARRVCTITTHMMSTASDQSESQQRKHAELKPAVGSAGFSWCATEEKVAAAARGSPTRPAWPAGLTHQSFLSPSMNELVGYCIYLPPGYDDSSPDWRSPRLNGGDRRYPVVYYLHGGRPGGELLSTGMASYIAAAMEAGTVPPAIYVFPNGGPLSHYNFPHDTACVYSASAPS